MTGSNKVISFLQANNEYEYRIFVAFRADTADFVSGRTFPNFLGITVTSVSSDSVEFAFKGKEPLRVRVPSGFNNEELK